MHFFRLLCDLEQLDLRICYSGMEETPQGLENRIRTAILQVKRVLECAESPTEVSHEYSDKFLLSEYLCELLVVCQSNVFSNLGLYEVLEEYSTRYESATLRFEAEEQCKFLKQETKEVEELNKSVDTSRFRRKTQKTITMVNTYTWEFICSYRLVVYPVTNIQHKTIILERSSTCQLKTETESMPRPKHVIRDNLEVSLNWYLNMIKDGIVEFSIDKSDPDCYTPRRNPQVEEVFLYLHNMRKFYQRIISYFTKGIFPLDERSHELDLSSMTKVGSIFNPIVPVFQECPVELDVNLEIKSVISIIEKTTKSSVMVSVPGLHVLVNEFIRTLTGKQHVLGDIYSFGFNLVTFKEANLVMMCSVLKELCISCMNGFDYVENMLYKQIISAIGKVVTPKEFQDYMLYHNRKLFKKSYSPKSFCYAIRRPDHYPEGVLSIESSKECIYTQVNNMEGNLPMSFSINAGTTITITGTHHVHAWVRHEFHTESIGGSFLNARARQFSSFMLILGTISSASQFTPKHGIILQNKDHLMVPLLMEQVPTPKAFRNAVESLSPEQRRFAKAYRSLQLEGTLFCVCIIQIKPQLEKLLCLPNDSLTREIKLTQDLMTLFIEYQIPSDILSFQGDTTTDVFHKLEYVKSRVEELQNMINVEKERIVLEHQELLDYESSDCTDMDEDVMMDEDEIDMKEGDMDIEEQEIETSNVLSERPERDFGHEIPETRDYTLIPDQLNKAFDKFDVDNALHGTIINVAESWTLCRQPTLLGKSIELTVNADGLLLERNRCFDLLDAITKSGSLVLKDTQLHVILASTHLFEESVMNTIIQKNMNPIESFERSSLLIGSIIQNMNVEGLVSSNKLEDLRRLHPILFQ